MPKNAPKQFASLLALKIKGLFLDIQTFDKLENFMIEKDHVIQRPTTVDVRDLKGILKREPNKTVSIEEMNATIVRGATNVIGDQTK
ncbi:MAG: hypothetical protein VSS75_007415 [Candidatus Parabeggiatoa sp.]|nr:hypothetical protein [Candidatus Parabeggiatoa sp.]